MYHYKCTLCKQDLERNVPINLRDEQRHECGNILTRQYDFNGLVWAPTSGGLK